MGTWRRGDQGRFSGRATPAVSTRYCQACVSLVSDRKRLWKNAARGKGLTLLTSAALGADAGRCHANSRIMERFLLRLIRRCRVLLTAHTTISPLVSGEDCAPFIFPIDGRYCGCGFIRAGPVNDKRLLAGAVTRCR